MRIEDGTGDGRYAEVDKKKRLVVRSASEPIFQSVSDIDGQAFSFYSAFTTAGVDEEVIYIKNTHTEKHLHIQNIIVTSSAATDWTLFQVASGTVAGTTLVPKNLNLSSGVTAQATSFGNAEVTGTLTGDTISVISSVASGTEFFNMRGALIISANDEIAITASVAGDVKITILAFYEDID